jgi:opacity protein-like surface antigen
MKLFLTAAVLALASASAQAQEAAPDGSKAFGLEPYVGVMGGYDVYNRRSEFGTNGARGKMNGGVLEGVAGANIPLGTFFVGAEGTVSKGFKDIDWEYGVRGRAGLRAGTSGLIYASAGYMWVNGDHGFSDQKDWIYGVGVEVGPKDIGLGGVTDSAGPRLRLHVDTYDFDSIRPMAGVMFHF